MDGKSWYKYISETFGMVGTALVIDAMESIIKWLIVMFVVILCNMITDIRTRLVMKESIQFGDMFIKMISKTVAYFSFVVMGVFLNLITKGEYKIDTWLLLFLCVVEVSLIVGNIIRPLGFSVDLGGAIVVFLKKIFGIDKEDSRDIIKNSSKKTVKMKKNGQD